MIKIDEAVIVEGIYDKTKLEQFIDATIITTNGFSIFKDKQRLALLQKLAERKGIVVLTDSDRAGFMIRNYIKRCIPAQYIKHAYIPEIRGKERRKAVPGKEGLLGVEGIQSEIVIKALEQAGCIINKDTIRSGKLVTKEDFYKDGLSGRPYSSKWRIMLTQKLSLPSRISTNALLGVINAICSYDEYKELILQLTDNK